MFQEQPGRSGMTQDGHWHGQPHWHGPPPTRPGQEPDWVRHTRKWRNRGDGQPLRRDSEDRLAGGVAAGLAAWRGFSPTTVRIVLAVAAFLTAGWAVPVYVLGWLLIPVKGEEVSIATRAKHDSRGMAIARRWPASCSWRPRWCCCSAPGGCGSPAT
jgi:phage shock protein PspC (stress-responsive transcriptional regulator)